MAGMQETDHITLKNGITYLLQDAKARAKLAELLVEVMEKYGADNPPPYPVTSVNGQTGDVTVQGGSGSGIAIQDDEPTDGELVWIDTDDSGTTHIIPEIDDTQESAVDTWSSQKIAEEFAGVLPLGEVATNIPSGANLNGYDMPGVYAIRNNAIAVTLVNSPSVLAGVLRIFSSNGGNISASSTWKYLLQEYITYRGARYQRYGESGSGTAVTWGAWETVYDSRDFPLPIASGGTGASNAATALSNLGALPANTITYGTWTPKIYDYETYRRDMAPQFYIKIGRLYVLFLAENPFQATTFNTMIQIRNSPCPHMYSGVVYAAVASGQGGTWTVQGSNSNIFLRPNYQGTLSGGWFQGVFFGYGD